MFQLNNVPEELKKTIALMVSKYGIDTVLQELTTHAELNSNKDSPVNFKIYWKSIHSALSVVACMAQ